MREGVQRSRIQAVCGRVRDALRAAPADPMLPFTLALLDHQLVDAPEFEALVQTSIDALGAKSDSFGFTMYDDLGPALCLQKLLDALGVEADVCADIDVALHRHVTRPQRSNDFLAGRAGHLVYLLERPSNERNVATRHSVVNALIADQQRDAHGVYWVPGETMSEWGSAHGSAGIARALTMLAERGGLGLEGAAVLTSALERLSWRASTKLEETGDNHALRLRWCNGDLGVAQTLLHGGRVLGRSDLGAAGAALARRAATVNPHEGALREANLCHGSTGAAMQLAMIASVLDDDSLRAASRAWFEHALTFECESRFRFQAGLLNDDASFQIGASGIGLAFAASLSDEPPEWARFMLAF